MSVGPRLAWGLCWVTPHTLGALAGLPRFTQRSNTARTNLGRFLVILPNIHFLSLQTNKHFQANRRVFEKDHPFHLKCFNHSQNQKSKSCSVESGAFVEEVSIWPLCQWLWPHLLHLRYDRYCGRGRRAEWQQSFQKLVDTARLCTRDVQGG